MPSASPTAPRRTGLLDPSAPYLWERILMWALIVSCTVGPVAGAWWPGG